MCPSSKSLGPLNSRCLLSSLPLFPHTLIQIAAIEVILWFSAIFSSLLDNIP